MIPLNHILRKCIGEYKFANPQEKINHLMYKDNINSCLKKKKKERLEYKQ